MCHRDSLERHQTSTESVQEAPWCSHLFYPQPYVLDEQKPEERAWGISAGLAWGDVAPVRAVYMDLGTSKGVDAAMEHAQAIGQRVETRWLRPDLRAEFERRCDQDPLDPEKLADAILEGQRRHGHSRDALVKVMAEIVASLPQSGIWV